METCLEGRAVGLSDRHVSEQAECLGYLRACQQSLRIVRLWPDNKLMASVSPTLQFWPLTIFFPVLM